MTLRPRLAMAVTVGAVIVGLTALGWLLWSYRQATEFTITESEPQPSFGLPTRLETVSELPATVKVTLSEGLTITAPLNWDGLITELHLAPGDLLVDRQSFGAVDGISRWLAVTDHPFYRSLARGDRGRDVEQLQLLLNRWGYLADLPSDPTVVSWQTIRAIGRLSTDLGSPRARVFDPAWLIWLPSNAPSSRVGQVKVTVGAPAPPTGAVLLQAEPTVLPDRHITVREAQGLDPDINWIFAVTGNDGTTRELSIVDGDIPDEELYEALLHATPEGDSTPDTAGLRTVTLSGRAISATPTLQLLVPATSIRPSPDGTKACVFTRQPGTSDWLPQPVKVHSAPGSAVALPFSPSLARREILHNPTQILRSPLCPS